jgi:hypothetical protein
VASDPFPPLRSNVGEFYGTQLEMEFLQLENPVIEDVGGDPDAPVMASVLDTLYDATSSSLPPPIQNANNVVMTYFYGATATQGVLFSGFNLWAFKRAHCQALVDFVLRDVWHLTRSPKPNRAIRAEVAPARGAALARSAPARGWRLAREPMRARHMTRPTARE